MMRKRCSTYFATLAFMSFLVTHALGRAEAGKTSSLCMKSRPDGEKSGDCVKAINQVKTGRGMTISGLSLIAAGSIMASFGIMEGMCWEHCDDEDATYESGMLAMGVIGAIAAATGYGLTFSGIPVWTGGWLRVARLNHQAAAAGQAPPQFVPYAVGYYTKRKKIGMGLAIPGFVLVGSGIIITGIAGAAFTYKLLGVGISFLGAGAILSIAGGALWSLAARNKRLFESVSAPAPAPSPVAWFDPGTRTWYAGIRSAW